MPFGTSYLGVWANSLGHKVRTHASPIAHCPLPTAESSRFAGADPEPRDPVVTCGDLQEPTSTSVVSSGDL